MFSIVKYFLAIGVRAVSRVSNRVEDEFGVTGAVCECVCVGGLSPDIYPTLHHHRRKHTHTHTHYNPIPSICHPPVFLSERISVRQ